jgi:hypothetical protein
MSDTPETNNIIRNAQTDEHPPTRLASTLTVKCERLERERDEAREQAQRFRSLHYSHLGINGSASWFPWEGHE